MVRSFRSCCASKILLSKNRELLHYAHGLARADCHALQRVYVLKHWTVIVTFALSLTVLTGPHGPAFADDPLLVPGEEPLLKPVQSIDSKKIMGLIGAGRVDSVFMILDSEQYAHSADPLVLLLRARAMRDTLSDEDSNKGLVKRDAQPIHDVLDEVIFVCNAAFEHRTTDPRFYYYRGRAQLYKAQLYVLHRSYWSGGRAAGRAKKDLRKYLELVPDDPDANGDLGVVLYFADALPGLVKFISKLLFFPSGDREKGLEMIQYAAASDGTFTMDYKIALAAIYVVFEGRLEDMETVLIDVIDRYPDYTRLAETIGVFAPLNPLDLRDLQRVEDRAMRRHISRRGSNADWSVIKRMQYNRTYADMYFRSPARSVYGLTTLVDNPPARPDWVLPLCLLNRSVLYAMMGKTDEASAGFTLVKNSEQMKFFHDVSEDLLDDLDKPSPTLPIEELDWIGLIYDGRLLQAEEALAAYRYQYGEDIIYYFYLGELSVFKQEFEAAAIAYEEALKLELPRRDQSYQMFAALRLAEIHGHELRYDTAVDYIDRARKFTHPGYLFDYSLRARTRYYKLLKSDKITQLPSLLFYREPDRDAPGHSER